MTAQEPQVFLLAGALAALWRQAKLRRKTWSKSIQEPQEALGSCQSVVCRFNQNQNGTQIGDCSKHQVVSSSSGYVSYVCLPAVRFTATDSLVLDEFLPPGEVNVNESCRSWLVDWWGVLLLPELPLHRCVYGRYSVPQKQALSDNVTHGWCSKSLEIPMIEATTFMGLTFLNQYWPWDRWWTTLQWDFHPVLFQG